MIPAHRLTTEPVTAHFAGCAWPLIFDMWAIRKLGQRVAPEETGLDWLKPLMTKVAAGDIDALAVCLWTGMLRENPGLKFEDTLALLDEASMADLVALPGQVLAAFQEAFGDSDGSDSGRDPWDWEMALGVWVKEWGRSEAEFWQTTFRTFTSISNGLSRLYKAAEKASGNSPSKVEPPAEGYTLLDMLTWRRR